ncbi:MAG: tetratricopeptide repeat protein [Boseongicola sp.]
MSNEDSFITEVTEEVRRDRLFKIFRRYGWIAVLVVVLIVGGAALNEWRKARVTAEAQAVGDAIILALESEDPSARAEALAALDAGDNQSRNAVLGLMAANAAFDSGDVEGAVTKLENLANNATMPTPFRDLATIKASILGAQSLPPEERIARLNSLSLGSSAFRLIAMEQIALAEIELGKSDAAIAILRDIVADASVTQDLRRRASQLIVALGGALTAG